jgi:hypothetical protein
LETNTYKDIGNYKSFVPESVSKSDNVLQFIELLKFPEVKEVLFSLFSEFMATAETKPLKRISTVETVLGLNDYADDEVQTIPEQINLLAERIENLELNRPSSVIPQDPMNIIPETKTEARAVYLVQYLEKEVKERNGELFLNNRELKEFFTRIVPEKSPDYTVKKGQNLRKIKKDVITKAKQLFPNSIFINKNKNGRHETRVLFKPSYPTVT